VINTLLFDMDGVLLDSSAIHTKAYLDTFNAFDIKIEFNYLDSAGKSTLDVMTEVVSSIGYINLDPNHLTKYKQECVNKTFKNLTEIPLFPSVEDVLIELSNNFRLALCTSASRGTTDAFFQSRVSRELFVEVITSDQVSSSKPEPEIYLLAMDKLKVTASECLVIEDSLAGLKSGLASGASVCRIGDARSISNLPRLISSQITNFETLIELANYLRVRN